ncbi:hypothetical protein C2S51_010865 [Perilla frutescens var. frutescens]|nr:hypothetical protein C2S51_010865 [Perilla frutescens var. frutescens]
MAITLWPLPLIDMLLRQLLPLMGCQSMTAKNQDIDQLEETIDELKSDLEMREDEISTLVENMRATEVKQRLSGQKLRITEQVLSEKEESHQKRVEKLQEEQRLLEPRIASLVSVYKEAQIYEIGNELKVAVNWITGNNAEKDQLKKEIVSLLQQLKDGDEIAEQRGCKEKAKELEAMIELKEEKVGELERKMREKDSTDCHTLMGCLCLLPSGSY